MSEPAIDKRRIKRRALITKAFLDVNEDAPRQCRVLDISETGARLAADPQPLPDRFVLLLSANGAVRRICDLVWQNNGEVGVRFVKPPPAKAP
jgi:hypothetical protein